MQVLWRWVRAVLLGLASLVSGFLGAITHVAAQQPAARDLRLGQQLFDISLAQLPAWPWYVLTPLLMTLTFLAIEAAHGTHRAAGSEREQASNEESPTSR